MANKATQTGSVERDGFKGAVYEREDGKKFVAWTLASLTAADGKPASITGITGENGGPKAAAYNLDHSVNTSYLQRLLGSRAYVAKAEAGVSYYVPEARIQVSGFDKPLELTLEARVGSARDRSLAMAQLAEQVKRQVAKGVYARYNQIAPKNAEPESAPSTDALFEGVSF